MAIFNSFLYVYQRVDLGSDRGSAAACFRGTEQLDGWRFFECRCKCTDRWGLIYIYIYTYTTQRKYVVVVAIYWNLSYFSGTYFAQYTYHNIIYIYVLHHTWTLHWKFLLRLGQWDFQDPKLEVPTIYKAYVREHPHEIWPYMVQYLHFRILKFPLTGLFLLVFQYVSRGFQIIRCDMKPV